MISAGSRIYGDGKGGEKCEDREMNSVERERDEPIRVKEAW